MSDDLSDERPEGEGPSLAQQYGGLLRASRLERDVTPAQLAEALGVTATMIRAIERGARLPSRDLSIRIAAELADPTLPVRSKYGGGGFVQRPIQLPATAPAPPPTAPRVAPAAPPAPDGMLTGWTPPPSLFVDVEPPWTRHPVVLPDEFGSIPAEAFRDIRLREAEAMRRASQGEASHLALTSQLSHRRRGLGPVNSRTGRASGLRV